MNKSEVNTTERYTNQDAQRSLERLDNLLETKWSYSSGNFPLAMYSSGERKVNRKGEETDEFVSLPIEKPRSGLEKGLMFGLKHAIVGTIKELERMGLDDIARERLIFDSKMPGGNISYKEGVNKKDGEDCKGA